jgi:hypothetical protein
MYLQHLQDKRVYVITAWDKRQTRSGLWTISYTHAVIFIFFVYSVNQKYTKESKERLLLFVGLINVEQHSKRKQAGETQQINTVKVLIPVALRSKQWV